MAWTEESSATRAHAKRLPWFARSFQATCPVQSDGSWMAVVSESGDSYVATTTPDAAFLFNNTEFGCIHAAPSLGDIAPGEEAAATNRIYFAKGDLKDFLKRCEADRK